MLLGSLVKKPPFESVRACAMVGSGLVFASDGLCWKDNVLPGQASSAGESFEVTPGLISNFSGKSRACCFLSARVFETNPDTKPCYLKCLT